MVAHHELPLPRRIAIMVVLLLSSLVQFIPLGSGIGTALNIGKELGASSAQATWIAAAYPMAQGAVVLIGGKLGDVYGHKLMWCLAAVWWVIWTLVTGFAPGIVTVALFRGLSGIAAGVLLPNAVALLMITFPPGWMRNLAMGSFGAAAPIGAAGGSIFGGIFVQLTPWKWLFFFLAILGTVVYSGVFIVVPGDEKPEKREHLDWVGIYLGVGGLILFNFVWTQAPVVGWQTPYEYILLIVAILHIGAFLFWESRVAEEAILPFDIWTAPSFGALVVVVFFTNMSFGIVLWYTVLWELVIREMILLPACATFIPLAIGGAIAAITAGLLVSRLAAQYILALGALSSLVSHILIATMPAQQNYWKQVFPAICIMAFCPDFIFTAAQIIASNSVSRRHQGVAASLIGVLQTYGLGTGLGFGGTVEVHTNDGGRNLVAGFRGALYLGMGMAAFSLILALLFIRIRKDEREGWDEADMIDNPVPEMREA